MDGWMDDLGWSSPCSSCSKILSTVGIIGMGLGSRWMDWVDDINLMLTLSSCSKILSRIGMIGMGMGYMDGLGWCSPCHPVPKYYKIPKKNSINNWDGFGWCSLLTLSSCSKILSTIGIISSTLKVDFGALSSSAASWDPPPSSSSSSWWWSSGDKMTKDKIGW